MKTKEEIRKRILAKRRGISAARRAEASKRVCERLLVRGDVRAAMAAGGPVAVYLAADGEIDLSRFVSAALGEGVRLAAPRWDGSSYRLAPLRGLGDGDLREGPHGISEPREDGEVAPPRLWLVPGVAFTRDGARLGYGGGWYDRFLGAADSAAVALGVGYRFQTVAEIPQEPHDRRISGVVDDGISLDWERSVGGLVAGVDEAGRGPLVGGVYAAAVAVPVDLAEGLRRGAWREIDDSKRLTESARDRLAGVIRSTEGCLWSVASASAAEIDSVNILAATHLAMGRAVADVAARAGGPLTALVDGLPVKGLACPSRNLVKGDAKSLLVAAASILAKTSRDADCLRLERLYPGYGFAVHKGYPTKAHLEALARLGPCPEHRRSFGPVADCGIISPL